MTTPTIPLQLKPLYTVNELARERILPFSRSRLYELIRAGRLRTIRERSVQLVPASAIVDYVELLEREAKTA